MVEVALIRPGPIQGGSVHPYIRRANGREEVTVPAPLMRQALEKTLGVPLFQEQLMQLAIDVAGFTPAEADQLRRAMGAKRSMEQMAELRDRLYDGMAATGITGALADDIYLKLSAFANYGFPESHAMSFAYLVYASAWLKRYHPAAFCAALLNAQPMGFYSPQSLVDDARRHGVEVRRPDINVSDAKATLETTPDTRRSAPEPASRRGDWGRGGPAVRLGLSSVRTLGDDVAERIEDERRGGRPVPRHDRPGPPRRPVHRAPGGAGHRGRVRRLRPDPPGGAVGGGRGRAGARRPAARHGHRRRRADAAGHGRGRPAGRRRVGHRPVPGHPSGPVRPRRNSTGSARCRSTALAGVPDKTRVLVGGIVTHRQRPAHRRRGHLHQPRGRDRACST